MRFLVITDAPTLYKNGKHCAYAPYVTEMDIWFSHNKENIIFSPTSYNKKLLVSAFKRQPQVLSS